MTELIHTLDNPGEFDALSKLGKNEPYFLLLGRDRLAPPAVQKWADDNRARALAEFAEGKIDKERRDRELAKSSEAEAIGWEMTAFKAGDMAKKVVGEPTAKTYSGFQLDPETKRRDDMQRARIRAVATCKEAIDALTEVAEMLAPGRAKGMSNRALTVLRETADVVAPPSREEILEGVQ